MSKADAAFEKWLPGQILVEIIKLPWSKEYAERVYRNIWNDAWKARGVADVEAVEAAYAAVPWAIMGISSGLAEDAKARIAALDEGGGG